MSKIKSHLEDRIATLAGMTGYTFGFLIDRYNEVIEDGNDWSYFVDVTLERDW